MGKKNILRGVEQAIKDGNVVSGEGFNAGRGHMDVAVVLGKDPDCPFPDIRMISIQQCCSATGANWMQAQSADFILMQQLKSITM